MKISDKLRYGFTSLKLFLREHKFFVLLGCASLLAGIAIGVAAARGAGEDYYKLNFIFEIKAGTYPFARTFFVAVLCVLGSFAVILPCGFNKWLSVPAFLLVGFWGYRLGLNLVGCLQPSATSGAVCIVLYYLPVYLTAAGALIAFICTVFSNSCGTGMSSARLKKLIFKALPLLAVFAAMALICGVIIPLLYRLIFL